MKRLTLMCDYSADGLWKDGAAVSWEDIVQDNELTGDVALEFEEIGRQIDNWQSQYEAFNLYESTDESEGVYGTEDFKKFMKLGEELFFKLDAFIKKYKLPYIVEYFEEITSKRYIIVDNKIVEKK